MPDGGSPLHMTIHPSLGDSCVVYARGSALHIIKRHDWLEHGAQAEPLLSLTPAEVRVLATLVQYWSGDETATPIYSLPEVRVEFDY
jgi:hypothetical protein